MGALGTDRSVFPLANPSLRKLRFHPFSFNGSTAMFRFIMYFIYTNTVIVLY